MVARTDLSATRKNQILDAAMTVFARSGFHEARMDDIVQESGLSKGTLYWYFKSKEEIIFEFYAAALRQDSVRQFIKTYFQNFHKLLVALIQQGNIARCKFKISRGNTLSLAPPNLYAHSKLMDYTAWGWPMVARFFVCAGSSLPSG